MIAVSFLAELKTSLSLFSSLIRDQVDEFAVRLFSNFYLKSKQTNNQQKQQAASSWCFLNGFVILWVPAPSVCKKLNLLHPTEQISSRTSRTLGAIDCKVVVRI